MGKALTDKKKEDKEDILPKKEEIMKKEELDTLQFFSGTLPPTIKLTAYLQ